MTWCLSGVWQNLGSGSSPRPGQAAAIRGGATRWEVMDLSEAEALARLRATFGTGIAPIAVDLKQFDGRPGFEVHAAGGRAVLGGARGGGPPGGIAEAAGRPA